VNILSLMLNRTIKIVFLMQSIKRLCKTMNRIFATKSRTINVNTRCNPRQNTSGIVLLEMCPPNGLSLSESPWGYYVSGHYIYFIIIIFFVVVWTSCVIKNQSNIRNMSNVFFSVGVLYFFFQQYFEI